MTTARRYEMGRPVFDNRAESSATRRTKNVGASPATRPPVSASTPDPEAPKAAAKVVRRAPPSIRPYAPGTFEADSALSAVAQTLADASSASHMATEAKPPVAEIATVEKSVAVIKPQADADEEITDTSNMRKFLLRQMVRAAKGEITTETVKNIVTLSQQVYNATSLELKAAAILKDSERSIRALELVSPQDADQ